MPRFRAALARSLRRRARAHPGPGRRAAGARSARALPDRSRRRGHHRPARLSRRHPDVPQRGRAAGRLGHHARRHRRARGAAAAVSPEADLHQPDAPQPDRHHACRSARGASCWSSPRATACRSSRTTPIASWRCTGAAAAAVALQARRGAHRRHPHQQLCEDAGAGAAPRLDQRRAADHRAARADQAAGRSAHAEPVAAGRLRAGRAGRARRASGDAQDRASAPARCDGAGAAAARAGRAAAVQRARRRHVSVVRAARPASAPAPCRTARCASR